MSKRICTVESCERTPSDGHRMCSAHRLRSYAGKPMDSPIRTTLPPSATPSERLYARLVIGGPDECWVWAGGTSQKGYGKMRCVPGGNYQYTHRVSWAVHNGPIPDGLHVLHHCDNPPCCNPNHLFLGTNDDNVADKMSKNRHYAGESSPVAKLSESDVLEIRKIGREQVASVAKRYKVDPSTIYSIINRRTWKHV